MSRKDPSTRRGLILSALLTCASPAASYAKEVIYYDLPFYFVTFNDGKPAAHPYDDYKQVIIAATTTLLDIAPPQYPDACEIQRQDFSDHEHLGRGEVAEVFFVQTNPDPDVSCPSKRLTVYWTPYTYDPDKNAGDAGNCNGGNGTPQGDSHQVGVVCPGTAMVGDPINAATGNKFEQITDFESSPWLSFRRFYNSQTLVRPGSLGPNWRHSFDRTLVFANTLPVGTGTTYLKLVRPDGRVEKFMPTQSDEWQATPDITDRITSERDTKGKLTGYRVFVARPREVEQYATDGRLISITDASGLATHFTYDGQQLRRVTDPFGRHIDFAYANGLLDTVTLPDGGTLAYSYRDGMLASIRFPDGRSKGYKYNEPDKTSKASLPTALTGEIDEAGVRFANTTYNAKGQATATGHALGANAITLSEIGDHPLLTNAYGRQHRLNFKDDGFGSLRLTYADNGGCMTRWCKQPWLSREYDAKGHPLSFKTPGSRRTDVTYDSHGLETERIEGANAAGSGLANKRITRTTWDSARRLPLVRTVHKHDDTPFSREAWTYNDRGQTTAHCKIDPTVADAMNYTCGSARRAPLGVRQTSFTYCDSVGPTCPAIGLLLSSTAPRTDIEQTTRYTYYVTAATSTCGKPGADCHQPGDLQRVTDPSGQSITFNAYDANGRVTRMTDANGVITDMTYSPRGWVTSRSIGGATTTYTYTPFGEVESTTDADGVVTRFTYDDAHRLTDITDAKGNRIHYGLDVEGHRITEDTYASGSTTPSRHIARTFDNSGFPQTTKDGQDRTTHTIYQGMDQTLYGYETADGVGHYISYDELKRVKRTSSNLPSSDPFNPIYTSQEYAYDLGDQVTRITLGDYLSTLYANDAMGNGAGLDSPDTGVSTSTFDMAGNRISYMDARGQLASSAYDVLDRLVSTTYAEPSSNVTYHYDEANSVTRCTTSHAIGRLTRIVEARITTTYCYDAMGRVTRKTQSQNGNDDVVQYAYTAAGRLKRQVNPSGTAIDYQYDATGHIEAVRATPQGGASTDIATQVTWLPFGPVASYTLGNGQIVRRTYDLNYRWTDIESPALALHVARDIMGNIVALGDGFGALPVRETYTYDFMQRLTSVKDEAGNVLEAYEYNAIGDRKSKISMLNAQATGTYTYKPRTHHLIATGDLTRTYDANGNTISLSHDGNTFDLAYDARNRLSTTSSGGQVIAHYTINAKGERTAKTKGATEDRYAYDESSHLLGECGTTCRDYVWLTDIPVGLIDEGTSTAIHYVHADGLGTPRSATGQSGKMSWTWSYSRNPFGEQHPLEHGLALNLRFAGQYHDEESALSQNIHREFDSASARYAQADPLGHRAGPNVYAYASGTPLSHTDPLGLDDSAAMFNPDFWGRIPPAAPDYYTFNMSYLVGSMSATLTRSGNVYWGFGPVYGGPKSKINLKSIGFSFASGILNGCDHQPGTIDNYVQGSATGASAYYWLGGGATYNSSGSSFETGFGTPGASYQIYEYNTPVVNTWISW